MGLVCLSIGYSTPTRGISFILLVPQHLYKLLIPLVLYYNLYIYILFIRVLGGPIYSWPLLIVVFLLELLTGHPGYSDELTIVCLFAANMTNLIYEVDSWPVAFEATN